MSNDNPLRHELSGASGPPPEVTVKGTTRRSGHVVEAIEFDGWNGATVTGYRIPQHPTSYLNPALVAVHHVRGDRATFLNDALRFADLGFVVMLIELPGARPGSHQLTFDTSTGSGFRAEWMQLLGDVRRTIDVVANDPTVDRYRISYMGRGEGGMIAGALTVADDRIRAAVTVASAPRFSEVIRDSDEPRWSLFRSRHGADTVRQVVYAMAPLDLAACSRASNTTHWLHQYGPADAATPEAAIADLEQSSLISTQFERYETSPALDRDALASRVAYLRSF